MDGSRSSGDGDPLRAREGKSASSGSEKSQARKKRRRDAAAIARAEQKRKEEEEEAVRKIKEEEEAADRKRKDAKEETARKQKEKEDAARERRQLKKKTAVKMDLGDYLAMMELESESASPSVQDLKLKEHDWTAFGAQTVAEGKQKATALAKEKGKETDDDLAELFGQLLKETKHTDDGNHGQKPFYPAQVAAMKMLGSYQLIVDFMDVLADKKFRNLAIRIGKNDEYVWLHRAVSTFLISNDMEEDIEALIWKVSVVFKNKKSLKDLDSFMTSKGKVNRRVLDNHMKRYSYNGTFKKEDILLGEDFCWIYGNMLKDQANSSYQKDFSKIWELMSPFYVVKGKHYPMNFVLLWHTLTLTGIPVSEVTKEWYRTFLRYHTTLASPEANRYFTLELVRLVKENPWIANTGFMSCIPRGLWQTWGQRQGGPPKDWRTTFAHTNSLILRGVYDYDPDNAGHEGNAMASGQQTDKAHPATKHSTSTNTSSQNNSSKKKNPYTNTARSILDYRRCIIVHGEWHGRGQFIVESINSTELYASQHLPDVMPYFLSAMLKQQLFSLYIYASLLVSYICLFDGGAD